MRLTFAHAYLKTLNELMIKPDIAFSCRGLAMWKELTAHTATIEIKDREIEVFSHRWHRVTPIRFTLAELCYILAGRDDVESIASYNKAMVHYSDDGQRMVGSYGLRLRHQLLPLIDRLTKDIHTRQACAAIYNEDDGVTTTRTHLPCNVFLQFLCRPPHLNLHVVSRSSDFATGFSIDTIHWQALLIMMANELAAKLGQQIYPSYIFYTIGSLHIYKADTDVIQQWTTEMGDGSRPYHAERYAFHIRMNLGLSEAVDRAKNMFKADLSIEELGEILMLNVDSMYNVKIMHEKFLSHRNKLVR